MTETPESATLLDQVLALQVENARLRVALAGLIRDLNNYKRIMNLGPESECWDSVVQAEALLNQPRSDR